MRLTEIWPRTAGIPAVDAAATELGGRNLNPGPPRGRHATGSTHNTSIDFHCLGALARELPSQHERQFTGAFEFAES
jgi:hypothetical protein